MSNISIFKPKKINNFIKTYGTKMHFEKDEFIYHLGDKTEHIYLVIYGEVFVIRLQEDGGEDATHYLKEGCLFGAVTLFCGPKVFSTFAKAKNETVVYRIEKEIFEEAVLNNHNYTNEWMMWIDIERSRNATKLRDLLMYGKMGALASVIIRLSNSFGVPTDDGIIINTKLTNQELAMLVGTSRELVNRYLKELKHNGFIEVDKKIIIVKNIDRLKQMVNCENCDINICQIF